MEENIKQHIITPLKGICNAPSDLTCDDEQLTECDGIVNVNGELQPIQMPQQFSVPMNGKLMYVHEISGEKRYIYTVTDDSKPSLCYGKTGGDPVGVEELSEGVNINQVTSTGKTLIVNASDGMHYYLWQDTSYKILGTEIPEPNMSFALTTDEETIYSTDRFNFVIHAKIKYNHGSCTGIIGGDGSKIEYDDQTKANDLFVGLYAKNKNDIADACGFCNPFLLRFGLELYDGSYTKLSAPILMLPSIRSNSFSRIRTDDGWYAYMITMYSTMVFSQITGYEDWTDIVRNVVVFKSKDIDIYDTTVDVNNTLCSNGEVLFDGVTIVHNGEQMKYHKLPASYEFSTADRSVNLIVFTNSDFNLNEDHSDVSAYSISGTHVWSWCDTDADNWVSTAPLKTLSEKTESTILDEIKNTSVFYKIADLGTAKHNGENISGYVSPHVLKNITTQTTITNEDYYSHSKLIPQKIAAYNKRLLLYNASRSMFKGFQLFMPYTVDGTTHSYTYYVTIQANNETRIVTNTFSTTDIITSDCVWFYYPDTRAKTLSLYCDGKCVLNEVPLSEHKGLNGTYYAGAKLPDGTQTASTTTGSFSGKVNESNEDLNGYVMQSEVYNPFVFYASGYVSIGHGDVIGIAGLTTALSQDAYKVSTTLCFTTQGIWALLTNDEGVFVNVPPAFSREVCNNAESITMTDNAVFFTSAKGLMCVTGASESAVVCVSNQLSGKGKSEFMAFLKDCRIAYDYRSGKLVIFKPYTSADDTSENVWIYDIASQTFAKKSKYLGLNGDSARKPLTVVGDYPDNIIQDNSYTLHTLYDKPQRDDDTNTYSAEIESRPMKLDGSLYLKSLRRLRNIMMLNDDATYTLKMYGSNDLKNWVELTSLQGKPFRFFKYKYAFSDLKATDTFSGILLDTQVRYTDRPH